MDADSVLKEVEAASQRKFLPIIGPVKGKYLVETVKQSRARKVLEIGTLVGYSAILIAKNLPDDGTVDTIEISPQSAKMAKENIEKAKLARELPCAKSTGRLGNLKSLRQFIPAAETAGCSCYNL